MTRKQERHIKLTPQPRREPDLKQLARVLIELAIASDGASQDAGDGRPSRSAEDRKAR